MFDLAQKKYKSKNSNKIIFQQDVITKFLHQEECFFMEKNGNFNVAISPSLIKSQSVGNKQMWIYFVIITNFDTNPYKLISRKWTVKEDKKDENYVSGNGVVGLNPIIEPMTSFEYFSHIIVDSDVTIIKGEFTMKNLVTEKTQTISTKEITLVNNDFVTLN